MDYEHLTETDELNAVEERLPGLERDLLNVRLDYEVNGTEQAKARVEEFEARLESLRKSRDQLAKKAKAKK